MTSATTRERQRWYGMLARCLNPNVRAYKHYGGRGITVCDRWRDFEAFSKDISELIGPCPPGMSLDRIDNDGNYEPGNVRWATPADQARNKRRSGNRQGSGFNPHVRYWPI
jgi:hypothetical protein